MTRLVQHISGVRRSDGRPCKRCTGAVPPQLRQRLIDAFHDERKGTGPTESTS